MQGWRAKIGLLVPSPNTTVEPEMYAMAPEGVTFFAARMLLPVKEIVDERAEQVADTLIEDIRNAVNRISTAQVDVIALACTTASFYKGIKFDREIVNMIEQISGVSATTTATASVEALKKMNIKKVAVSSPYVDWGVKRLGTYLEEAGLKVVSNKGLNIGRIHQVAEQPPQVVYKHAKEVNKPEADGIFISCTNFPTINVIEQLELDLAKPVVTANQATFWGALRKAGVNEPLNGYGKLLKSQ